MYYLLICIDKKEDYPVYKLWRGLLCEWIFTHSSKDDDLILINAIRISKVEYETYENKLGK